MKPKVSIPKRNKSNPPLKNLPPTSALEEETKKMEERLRNLKDVMSQQQQIREASGGTKWKASELNGTLKSYGKAVLEGKRTQPTAKVNKENFSNTVQVAGPRPKQSREKINLNSTTTPSSNPYAQNTSFTSLGEGDSTPVSGVNSMQTGGSQKSLKRPIVTPPTGRKPAGVTSLSSTTSTTTTTMKPMGSQITPRGSARAGVKVPPIQKQSSAQKKPIPKPEPKSNQYVDEEQEKGNKMLESNLKKALMNQKEDNDEVEDFLGAVKLNQYASVFKENGFDDLDTIIEIQTKHLVDMKIPAGHQIKIMKRIEKVRLDNPEYQKSIIPKEKKEQIQIVPQPKPQQEQRQDSPSKQYQQQSAALKKSQQATFETQTGDSQTDVETSVRGSTSERIMMPRPSSTQSTSRDSYIKGPSNYVELDPPTQENTKIGTQVAKPTKPITSSGGVGTTSDGGIGTSSGGVGTSTGTGGELLKGQFNEAESHASFLEALEEWRKGSKKAGGEDKKSDGQKPGKKAVRFQDGTIPEKDEDGVEKIEYVSSRAIKREKQKQSFLYAGGGNWSMGDDEYPTQQDTGTHTDTSTAKINKVSCWHCFKLVPEAKSISVGSRLFCGEECAKAYKVLNSITCAKNSCGKQVLKEEGIMKEGRWYCGIECTPTEEEILMEEQRMMRKLAYEQNSRLDALQKDREMIERGSNSGSVNNNSTDNEVDMDFTVSIGGGNSSSNAKEAGILSLEELEEKYKNMNSQK